MVLDSLSWTYYRLRKQFKAQGYNQVTTKELRAFVEGFLWKRQAPETLLEKKAAILSVTPNQFFDYQTIEIQKAKPLGLDQIDLEDLD